MNSHLITSNYVSIDVVSEFPHSHEKVLNFHFCMYKVFLYAVSGVSIKAMVCFLKKSIVPNYCFEKYGLSISENINA